MIINHLIQKQTLNNATVPASKTRMRNGSYALIPYLCSPKIKF